MTAEVVKSQLGEPIAGQRPGWSSGGSLTTSAPLSVRNPTAHSAVTAGAPKLRR